MPSVRRAIRLVLKLLGSIPVVAVAVVGLVGAIASLDEVDP
jgi:hypothetical protein